MTVDPRAFIVYVALSLAVTGFVAPAQATVLAQAGTVEIAFTPDDAIDRRIIALIDAAREEVHVLAYSFTHRGIARALLDARARGVRIEIVADRSQTLDLPQSALPELKRRGVAIWLDAARGSAHNKVLIVDPRSASATTVTGSFNFTRAAQASNAENVVIFHGNRDVARIYERYYERRRAAAQRWSDGVVARRPPPRAAPYVERRVP